MFHVEWKRKKSENEREREKKNRTRVKVTEVGPWYYAKKKKKNVNKQIISRKLQVIRKRFVEMRNTNKHRKKNIAQGYSWNQNVNSIACRSTDLRTYCSCFIVEDERLRCIQIAPFLWSKSHGLVTQPTRISNKICMGLHGRVVAVFTERRWAFMAGCRSCSLGKRSVVKWIDAPFVRENLITWIKMTCRWIIIVPFPSQW